MVPPILPNTDSFYVELSKTLKLKLKKLISLCLNTEGRSQLYLILHFIFNTIINIETIRLFFQHKKQNTDGRNERQG